eukprot:Partr_v1_DN26885_c0_g1_i2_m40262 putative WNK lysine deficient protein kinase
MASPSQQHVPAPHSQQQSGETASDGNHPPTKTASSTAGNTISNPSSNSNNNNNNSSHRTTPPNPASLGLVMTATTPNSTTLEQFVQAFNSNAEDGERIIEVSPNARYAKLNVVLGKGAYKVVYKAIDREEGYEVAWNCFQTSRAEFNELSQEIEILKRVRHPNIINFHDCWYNNVEFVFVTELMTSGTLREYIRKLQIPNMKIVKRWCRQILKGLLYLHSHDPSIIHRDIKCDNIFINGAHGEVKIGDMGTAKMKLGKKYTVIGTPEFMAPEMYEEKGYSEKVDVYAFGMCLLEMVTGEYPYSECTNAAQIYKKVIQGIKPDCLLRVKDTEVVNLLTHCLCTESERWSVTEVLEHPFLTVEPEVQLLVVDEAKGDLAMQVAFKGMDKLSVKFDFNIDHDTAEDVVSEMIQENVLPEKYQSLITHEINRILRDLQKGTANAADTKKEEDSNSSYKNELEQAKLLVLMANERALEAEKKAELSEVRARLAEEKHRNVGDSVGSATNVHVSSITTPTLSSSVAEAQAHAMLEEVAEPVVFKYYKDEQPIEDLVRDTAIANARDLDKAKNWLEK